MAVADLQSWADYAETVRLPAIEEDIAVNRAGISANTTLITQKAQELTDRLDAHSARITAARNIADAAEQDAIEAHSSVATLDITLRGYVDGRIQWVRDDLSAHLDHIQATIEGNVRTAVQTDIDTVLPDLQAENAAAIAEVNAARLATQQAQSDSQAAIDELYGTVLPGYSIQINALQDELGTVSGDLNAFLLGHSGESLLESLSGIRAENEARLAPMDMPAIREPRSMWGRDLDAPGPLWKNTLGLYGTFVTDDPGYGEAFEFGDGADTNIGPAYPLPFEAGRIYRITVKVRCVNDGTVGGADVMLGAVVNQAETQLTAQQKASQPATITMADGDTTLTLYVGSDQAALEEYGLEASRFLVLPGSATGTWIYPFVAQNPGSGRDGILRLGAFEVMDVSDVADGMKILRTELNASAGHLQGQISEIQALDIDSLEGTALAVFLEEMEVDALGNSAKISSLDTAVATLDGNVQAIQSNVVAVSGVSERGPSVLKSQFPGDPGKWLIHVTAPTVTENERYTLGSTWSWNIGTQEAGIGISSKNAEWVGAENPDAFAVEIEFELVSGSIEGAGISIAWDVAVYPNIWKHIPLSEGLDSPVTYNTPMVASFVVKRENDLPSTFEQCLFYFLANRPTVGTLTAKHIKVHRITLRPATISEAAVQEQKTAISTIEGHLSASYSLALIAGEESAGLQFVVSDDPYNPVSTLKASARNILLDGTVSTEHLVVTPNNDNMMPDPGFEDVPYWETYGASVVAAPEGWRGSSILWLNGGGSLLIANSPKFAVSPEDTLFTGFEGHLADGATGSVYCQLEFCSDDSFSAEARTGYGNMGGAVTTSWPLAQKEASEVVPPAGTRFARVQYVKQGDSGTSGWLGSAYVRRMVEASLVVNGSIQAQHLAAEQIISSSAQLGTANVETLTIAGNAISVPLAVFSNPFPDFLTVAPSNTVFTEIIAVSEDVYDGDASVQLSISFNNDTAGAKGLIQIERRHRSLSPGSVYSNWVGIHYMDTGVLKDSITTNDNMSFFSMATLDTRQTGIDEFREYRISVRPKTTGTSLKLCRIQFSAMQMKR